MTLVLALALTVTVAVLWRRVALRRCIARHPTSVAKRARAETYRGWPLVPSLPT